MDQKQAEAVCPANEGDGYTAIAHTAGSPASGTTGVARVLMGRTFIGIGRDAEYLHMSTRRIALAKLGQL